MRTALVGGGAGGIGQAAAAALLAAGHRVVLAGRHVDTLRAAADRLSHDPSQIDYLVCDFADPEAGRAVEAIEERHGALDILVLNAGGPPPGRVLEIDDQTWRASFQLLLLGPLALARQALPAMAPRGFGRVVVVVTSTAVRQPQPQLATSTVLRAAVTAAAKLLSLEYAAEGVTVNCVAPGAIDTARRSEILRSRAEAAGTDAVGELAADTAAIPAGRVGQPDEIGSVIAFLASEQASYVNGTVLAVDGGRTETV